MSGSTQRAIFLKAIELDDPIRRQAFLTSACGDDDALLASVNALLAAHDLPENPLDHPIVEKGLPASEVDRVPIDVTLAADSNDPSRQIGSMVGPYRLMEQIGEGGFGLVFVAQQEKPVKRKVALKIIKPGTGSKEVLARFDAERQAIAMMDHPHIARVFDAGVTDDAQPYFVMELVRGEPITDFCDHRGLSIDERVRLFQDVCAATHHAHQKGVVHRDLKPSNVMVTLHDDRPVVKVIDFGVAKAMGQNLTDQTIYTRFYSMIGTPLYMSPEQAAMSGLDVDTRSDIYSLGVLLYELLTGTTPFNRDRLDSVGYDEMRRIIREEEPPKPSTRLTTIESTDADTVEHGRSTEAPTSPHRGIVRKRESIPSDLDWIVMKAMEKDRTRRYESAAALSSDLRRFLSADPIEARPPSRGYRLRKFARRNRVALFTGSLVAAALVTGTAVSLYQASRAIVERNEKEEALQDAIEARREVENFAERLKTANVLVGNARTLEDARQHAEADSAYSEAVGLVPNYYLVWVQRATLRAGLHLWDEAGDDFSAAMRLEAPIDGRQWEGAAALFFLTNRESEYRDIYSRMMTPPIDDSPLPLHAIRSCLIAPASLDDAKRMTNDIEALISHSGGPPGRSSPGPEGEDHRFGGPDRGPGPNGGPGRQRGSGRDGGPGFNRGGGPGRGPGRGPGQGGPRFQDRAPRSVMEYVAAWANVRTENFERALDFLDLASESRGPSGDMVHALRAIASHRLGRNDEAMAALERADIAMDTTIREMTDTSDRQRPWIDFVEMVLLHREATKIVTGKDSSLDSRIDAAQQKIRESMGL